MLTRDPPAQVFERANNLSRSKQRESGHQTNTSTSRVVTVGGMPSSSRTARHSRIASATFDSASASVCPWLTQPGIDGHSAIICAVFVLVDADEELHAAHFSVLAQPIRHRQLRISRRPRLAHGETNAIASEYGAFSKVQLAPAIFSAVVNQDGRGRRHRCLAARRP
jgi:hypothetical protein